MQGLQRIKKVHEDLQKLVCNNASYIHTVTFDSIRKKSRNYSWLQLQILAKHQQKLELLMLELYSAIGELEDVY